MKKMILSLGVMLIFGIASAQTEPKATRPVQPEAPKTNTETKDKAKTGAEVQNDVNRDPEKKVVTRKDELKTRDHVKSTRDADRMNDTVAKPKKVKKRS